MEDIVGFFADRIARQIRVAREAAADQQRIAAEIAAPLPPDSAARARASKPPAPFAMTATSRRKAPDTAPVSPGANARSSPVSAFAERRSRATVDDAFPTLIDVVPVPGGPAPASALLAAFGGGNALLGAIVLSEALAPPFALRNGPPHRL